MESYQSLFNKALNLKEEARVSLLELHKYILAAQSLKQAIEIIDILLNRADIIFDDKITLSVLKSYYEHEMYQCLYSYNIENHNYIEAESQAITAATCIKKAIEIIDINSEKINEDERKYLQNLRVDFKFRELMNRSQCIYPKAKEAFYEEQYIVAYDIYKKIVKYEDETLEYAKQADMDNAYLRITEGNSLMFRVNASQAAIGVLNKNIYDSKIEKENLLIEVLENFIESYKFSIAASKANPEWTQYRLGVQKTEKNIKLVLEEITDWKKVYLHFQNEPILINIMKESNPEKVKQIEQDLSPNQPVHHYEFNGPVSNSIIGGSNNINTQNIHIEIDSIINAIDNSDASPEEKEQAKSLIGKLSKHPLFNSVVGGILSNVDKINNIDVPKLIHKLESLAAVIF